MLWLVFVCFAAPALYASWIEPRGICVAEHDIALGENTSVLLEISFLYVSVE